MLKPTLGKFMNGLMLVCAYTGFIVGNETASTAALALAWAAIVTGFAIYISVGVIIGAAGRISREGIKSDFTLNHAIRVRNALKGILAASRKISFPFECAVDIPMAALLVIGGHPIVAFFYAVQLFFIYRFARIGKSVPEQFFKEKA